MAKSMALCEGIMRVANQSLLFFTKMGGEIGEGSGITQREKSLQNLSTKTTKPQSGDVIRRK